MGSRVRVPSRPLFSFIRNQERCVVPDNSGRGFVVRTIEKLYLKQVRLFCFRPTMEYYVYIILSQSQGIYYRGSSANPHIRLTQHNLDQSRYTSGRGPWELVFIQTFQSKREALIREKKLKKYSKQQIKNLINSPLNDLKN